MKRKKNKNQTKIIIVSVFCFLLLITVGYAAFSTKLTLNAKGNVQKQDIDFTKVIKLNDIQKYNNISTNGTEFTKNEDESISFNGTHENTSNLIVPVPKEDFQNGFTVALDVYINFSGSSSAEDAESLMMIRTTVGNGFFLYTQNKDLLFDIGGSSQRTNIPNLTNGHYTFIATYGTNNNGYILINKDTKQTIINKTVPSLTNLNNGINLTNYELQIGADNRRVHNNYNYQTSNQTKFYSYYFNNVSMTDQELKTLMQEFELTDVANTIDLTPLK